MPNYLRLGKLVAIHGLNGELLLKHNLGKKSALKDLKAVFTEQPNKSFLPWFIVKTKIKSAEETYISLETISDREQAKKLLQKELWIPEEEFKRLSVKSSPVNLLGYTIIHDKKSLGEILELIEQPHQLLARIEVNKKEVLIPINENFLKKTDHQKKELILELPEGLLEVYLSS